MAMGLSRPDNSRARPSSLLKRDEDYKKIFSSSVPLPVYLWLAKSQKVVDAFLASEAANTTTQERTNLRFHLAMVAAATLLMRRVYDPANLNSVASEEHDIGEADLAQCLLHLRESFAQFAKQTGDAPDKIAKGPDFVKLSPGTRIPSRPGRDPDGFLRLVERSLRLVDRFAHYGCWSMSLQ